MGVIEVGGLRGNGFHRLFIGRRTLPGAGPRLLSVNADGFHSSDNREGSTIVGSEIAFTGDDLGNTHCTFYVVLQVPNRSSVVVIDHDGAPTGDGNLAHTLSAGSTLYFYHLNTLMPLLGDAPSTVVSAAPAKGPTISALLDSARATLANAPYSAGFTDAAFNNKAAVEIVVDRLPDAVEPLWSLVAHGTYLNAGATLVDSHVHDGYARNWMIKAPSMLVRGNIFARAAGLWVAAKQSWLEGDPGITDIVVEDNYLVDYCWTPHVTIDALVRGAVKQRNNTATCLVFE